MSYRCQIASLQNELSVIPECRHCSGTIKISCCVTLRNISKAIDSSTQIPCKIVSGNMKIHKNTDIAEGQTWIR
jgi:hypothetical protein